MAETSSNQGFYLYQEAGHEYFEKRQLSQSAKTLFLWGLGVGAAIFGHFFGWHFGLQEGGFWGMAIATILTGIMYICLVVSSAELSSALPYAGGFYLFARHAFGPLGAFISGSALTLVYLIRAVLIVFLIALSLNGLLPNVPLIVWAVIAYTLFVLINIHSTALTLKVGFGFTLLAVFILLSFHFGALATKTFDPDSLFNLPPLPGLSATWLPKGWGGVFGALPFAIWFFFSVELIPLAAEESYEAPDDIPKGLIISIFTLVTLSFFTLIVGSGVAGGVAAMGASNTPFQDGLAAILGVEPSTPFVSLIVVTALMASLPAAIFAYGRVLFVLSRAGYYPRWFSVTSRKKTPARALILGAVVGLICILLIEYIDRSRLLALLLNMAVFGSAISYLLLFASYIKLKRERPDLPRPYNSPLGSRGAIVGALLAILILLACFWNPLYRPGVVGGVIFILLSVIYFVFYSRKRLVAHVPAEEQASVIETYEPPIIKSLLSTRGLVFMSLLMVGIAGVLYLSLLRPAECPPNCIGANMIARNLSGKDLQGLSFLQANLHDANLSGANLRNASLSGALLIGANLENADLSGAKLLGADLSKANLGGVTVSGTDMRGANLSQSNLNKIDLTKVKVNGVDLSASQLIGANLKGVNLAGVDFTGAKLNGADLSGAILTGAILSEADLSGARMNKADLSGAWLNKTNLTGADLEGAYLNGASLIGATLASANLSEAKLVGALLIGADLNGANLRAANLRQAKLTALELGEKDLLRDPILKQLTELQRKELLRDADLSGVHSDNHTVWPVNRP